jgi:orotate phosphoribosyltransferase
LIVDDVITAGTAIRESMDLLNQCQAHVVGVVVALDREETTGAASQESSGKPLSAVQVTK